MPPSALRTIAPPERSTAAEPTALRFRLVRESIQPGERTTLEIELPLPLLEAAGWKEENGPPAVNDDLITQSKSFQVLDTTYRRTKQSLIWGYDLTSHRTGKTTIPPVEIRVGSQTFSTEALELQITTTRAENDNKLREEFGPLDLPSRWWYWLFWMSLLPIAYWVRLWLDKRLPKWLARFKARLPEPTPEPAEDPLVWLRRELARLKAELAHSPGEGFADDLTAVLREYFTRKHAAPVRAWTTREFTRHFSDEPTAKALVPVFYSCDEVKFTPRKMGLTERFSSAMDDTERVFQACGT